MSNLPNSPGLNRRNAYGEYVRKRNNIIFRNQHVNNSNNYNHNRNNNSILPLDYSPFYNHIVNNVSSDRDMVYEVLVNLKDVPNGLNIKTLLQNTKLEICKNDDFCVICQDHYVINQNILRVLKCEHKYHWKCIDNWFINNNNCPLCKVDIRE